MRKFLFSCFALLALSSSAAFAAAPKVSLCHYDADIDEWKLINIGSSAVDAHLTNHGDEYPGAFYPDMDGDGFGDDLGVTSNCPAEGYVSQAGDCDDSAATVNPDAAEVCGDDIDNNCNFQTDEDCEVVCPCSGGELWERALTGIPTTEIIGFACLESEDQLFAFWFAEALDAGMPDDVGTIAVGPSGPGELACGIESTGIGEYIFLITPEEASACRSIVEAWLIVNGDPMCIPG